MATRAEAKSSALWDEGKVGRRGGGSTEPPQDVASMNAEIADLQSKTTASLDRSIAVSG